MTTTFDPHDRTSWYFGQMTRQEATKLLMAEKEGGTFLIRDSTSIHGDYVLCVRENSKVSHYIINKVNDNNQTQYRIGDQNFLDLPSLLQFYTLHYLDTTPLLKPAPRHLKEEKVIAKYDFDGNDQDDLPFKKGDILTVVSKDEEEWWTAKNTLGQIGMIPVPYIQKYDGQASPLVSNNSMNKKEPLPIPTPATTTATGQTEVKKSTYQRQLPAFARVKQARIPNAYDKTALKLEIGDTIKVTKFNINGQWEGELNGKTGHFPFTHVELLDPENSADNSETS